MDNAENKRYYKDHSIDGQPVVDRETGVSVGKDFFNVNLLVDVLNNYYLQLEQLRAENKALKDEIEDWKLGSAAEAREGDKSRAEVETLKVENKQLEAKSVKYIKALSECQAIILSDFFNGNRGGNKLINEIYDIIEKAVSPPKHTNEN